MMVFLVFLEIRDILKLTKLVFWQSFLSDPPNWIQDYLFGAILFACLIPSNVHAQNSDVITRLRANSLSKNSPSLDLSYNKTISEDLQVETVNDIIKQRRQYEEFGMLYNNLLALEDSLNVSLLSELEDDERLAQSVFLYQSTREMGRLIMNSPTGLKVKKVLNQVKYLKDLTSFRVEQNDSGGLSMKGNRTADKRLTPIAEFSLHLSMRKGAEPRVTILDGVILSYNLFTDQALIEYEIDF